jgi:hypothetical protein
MPAKKTYEDHKKDAPTIPGPTCKYVDHVIDILIEEIKPMIPNKDKAHYLEVLNVLKTNMEYIRESNRSLRTSSKYWNDACKKLSQQIGDGS